MRKDEISIEGFSCLGNRILATGNFRQQKIQLIQANYRNSLIRRLGIVGSGAGERELPGDLQFGKLPSGSHHKRLASSVKTIVAMSPFSEKQRVIKASEGMLKEKPYSFF